MDRIRGRARELLHLDPAKVGKVETSPNQPVGRCLMKLARCSLNGGKSFWAVVDLEQTKSIDPG